MIIFYLKRCCDMENKLKTKLNEIDRLKQEIAYSQKYRKEQEDFIRKKKEEDILKEKVM